MKRRMRLDTALSISTVTEKYIDIRRWEHAFQKSANMKDRVLCTRGSEFGIGCVCLCCCVVYRGVCDRPFATFRFIWVGTYYRIL